MPTTLEDVVERAAQEGIPPATIARIVGLPVDEITPFLPADAVDHDTLMAAGMRFKTSPVQSRMLVALLRTGVLSRSALIEIAGKVSADVLLHKMRMKLHAWGLTVHTVNGVGYQMSPAEVEKARAILRGETP
jgi:hypothetical protein